MRRAPLSLFPPPLAGEGREGARSPVGVPPRLTPSGLAPVRRQLQARLPGTRQDVRSGTLAPTGERRPRAVTRALPAPACPSPGNAPPGPVIVPANMMPEAARRRSVSFRARAPHPLDPQEYPRPKASFTERDSLQCSGKRDRSQEKGDGNWPNGCGFGTPLRRRREHARCYLVLRQDVANIDHCILFHVGKCVFLLCWLGAPT